MRKSILIFLFMLLGAFSVRAADFKVDGIYYNIISEAVNQVEVTSSGSSSDRYSESVVIPATVEYDGNSYSVTSIGSNAFLLCYGLISVTIPNSVTAIGSSAFYGCYRLESVAIPNSVITIEYDAFGMCSALTSMTIPESVTTIGTGVFSGCSGLTSVTIPGSVTTIGSSAFSDCNGLTSVTILEGVTTIESHVFSGCSGLVSVTIPNSVTTIGDYAFSGCSSLASITIPENVTTIGAKAFGNCRGLTSVSIPEGVTAIGNNAFASCTGLISVSIPASVTSIEYAVFFGCSSLTSVTIPEGVATIGDCAFQGCSGLTSVEWNAVDCQDASGSDHRPFYGCENIMTVTFGNQVSHIPAYLCYGMNTLTSVTISEGVTSIGSSAFQGCSGLTSVSIPESVITIGDYAFQGCSGLTSVEWNAVAFQDFSTDNHLFDGGITSITFGSQVEYIPAYLCYGMNKLTSVMIPEGVTSIGSFAFYACKGLRAVTIPASVASIGGNVFGDYGLISVTSLATLPPYCEEENVFGNESSSEYYQTLYVPRGSKSAYKSAKEWHKFSKIEEIEDDIYTVTVRPNDTSMGIVTGGGEYASGAQAILAAIPNKGYYFDHWKDGNTDNPRTLMVTKDTTFTAIFAANEGPKTYTVTVQPNDTAMGTVIGGGNYGEGEQATLAAISNMGYHFVKWDDGNTDNPRILTVSGDTTLTAIFAEDEQDDPVIYTVTVQLNDADMGSVMGSGNYGEGEPATLVPIPNEGYHFVKWDDENTDNPRILTVSGDTTLTAIFAEDEQDDPVIYTVTVQPNDTAMGTVIGGGNYGEGEQATLAAISNMGYHFVKWNDGNTDNPRILTVSGDTTLTAIFAANESPKTYTVTVQPNDAAMGTVTGGGEYKNGEQAILAAIPHQGYYFDRWDDGNTNNPRILVVSGDTTITAIFAKNGDNPTANENPEADNFRVYVQDRTIYLSEDRGSVQVYNMAGQCVYNGRATDIPVPQSGVYIVVAGSQRLKVLVR